MDRPPASQKRCCCDEGETCTCAHKTGRRNAKGIQSPPSTEKSLAPSAALSPSQSGDRTAETSPTPARSCCAPSSTPQDTTATINPISITYPSIPGSLNSSDVLDPWNPSALDALPEIPLQGPQSLTEDWDLTPNLGVNPIAISTFDDPLSTMGPFDAGSLFNDIDISQIRIPDEWVVGDLAISEAHNPETQPDQL
ncbi:transcription activator CUP2 [Fusarium pseudocircinatum]|uniref:Transcription activator CUP2 n=1 Tax=Fusarium pseudocircinatum TaxID=56676 RepID=A0A8H5UTB7_9HYPO|nr:transcription activator CUP2 [Fusarium pseudocircinatum]